jgi:triphosphoribosyl-dephospho-CoA synthase
MVTDPNNIVTQQVRQLTQAYQSACMAELEALKPGNVHIFADGHGMVVEQFISSAEASAHYMADANLSLGQRIFKAVEATHQAVGCNTNLGIVLLCAPILQAALQQSTRTFQEKLSDVLANTSIEDAQFTFEAIQLAKPAGLGHSDQHDIHQKADCTLLEAMQAAALKDNVALQYSNEYYQIATEGLLHYQQALQKWERPAWATTALYLYWLAHYADSHVVRKYGLLVADALQKEARAHYVAFLQHDNPKLYLPDLRAFDRSLKDQGLNPGTSADLTVATLCWQHLLDAELA